MGIICRKNAARYAKLAKKLDKRQVIKYNYSNKIIKEI